MSSISADVLVVHGHGLTPEEELDAHTAQRMDTALEAYEQGAAPRLAVSGGHSFTLKNPPAMAEATVMRRYALERGVADENISVEDKSLDTVGNALFVKTRLAVPNEWGRLAVVTSESHLPRILNVYRHIFGRDFDIQGIAAPEQIGLKEKIWEPLGGALVKEVLRGTKTGDHEAVQARLFDLVPGYGGDTSVARLAFKSLTGVLKKH